MDMTKMGGVAPNGEMPRCVACGFTGDHWLGDHLDQKHGGIRTYLAAFGASTPTMSQAFFDAATKSSPPITKRTPVGKNRPPVKFGDVTFAYNDGVPLSACLPMPAHYQCPTKGALAGDVRDIMVSLKSGRSIWVSGPPGTGKDALFSAWSAMTRTPALLFQVVQGQDIQSWRFTRGFDTNGTRWEDGLLLKALRDGYEREDGTVIPYLIVLSDIDRATRSQMEELRSILDSIQGRIPGPDGKMHPVRKGSIIVATANTTGNGDDRGMCTSSNTVDSSIMDRFERAYKLSYMDPDDEAAILAAKYPDLHRDWPTVIPTMLKAIKAMRSATAKGELFFEPSHRVSDAWAGAAADWIAVVGCKGMNDGDLLRKSARAVVDKAGNVDIRNAIILHMDPVIPGGAIPGGNEIKKK